MKNYKNRTVVYFLVITFFCLMFSSSGYAWWNKKEELSLVEESWQEYCSYDGIFHDESRWVEEFMMLEEPSDHPNYEQMCSLLGIFMTMPDEFIAECPKLRKYLLELVKYHANNEKLTKDMQMILDFISQRKLTAKPKSILGDWFGWN